MKKPHSYDLALNAAAEAISAVAFERDPDTITILTRAAAEKLRAAINLAGGNRRGVIEEVTARIMRAMMRSADRIGAEVAKKHGSDAAAAWRREFDSQMPDCRARTAAMISAALAPRRARDH